MKKYVAFVLAVLTVFALCACGGETVNEMVEDVEVAEPTPTPTPTPDPVEDSVAKELNYVVFDNEDVSVVITSVDVGEAFFYDSFESTGELDDTPCIVFNYYFENKSDHELDIMFTDFSVNKWNLDSGAYICELDSGVQPGCKTQGQIKISVDALEKLIGSYEDLSELMFTVSIFDIDQYLQTIHETTVTVNF